VAALKPDDYANAWQERAAQRAKAVADGTAVDDGDEAARVEVTLSSVAHRYVKKSFVPLAMAAFGAYVPARWTPQEADEIGAQHPDVGRFFAKWATDHPDMAKPAPKPSSIKAAGYSAD
jgi:hypothetical protein